MVVLVCLCVYMSVEGVRGGGIGDYMKDPQDRGLRSTYHLFTTLKG